MPSFYPHKNILNHFRDRVHACWLGKSIGGTLGLPAEGQRTRLNFSFYDPVPESAPPNDDLELQLVWLDLVERSQSSLSQRDFSTAWLENIHYMWDEYGRCRWNLRRGVPLSSVGTFENHFHAGMGSPIRSEIWACLFPGDADSAAHYAALDASLDHGVEGIAGEVFFAVMQSLIADGLDLHAAIAASQRYIPAESELARAIRFILQQHRTGIPVWDAWGKLIDSHGNENFTHTPLNVALTLWALLYGDQDFEKSILLAANGGFDTDCTAATVGATLGLASGVAAIPDRWIAPIGEEVFVGPGIRGISAPKTLHELTDRTVALLGKLDAKKWTNEYWTASPPPVNLKDLQGTIEIAPFGQRAVVPWANGELPSDVKVAGGGEWECEMPEEEERVLICLARKGARLFVNGDLVIDCPPGLPYIPATHRSGDATFNPISLSAGSHRIRVELNSHQAEQDASVILTYPNRHICPWGSQDLPHPAIL